MKDFLEIVGTVACMGVIVFFVGLGLANLRWAELDSRHEMYCYKQNTYAMKDLVSGRRFCVIQEQLERLHEVKRESNG